MRDFIAEPISEIFEAAILLKHAVKAHLKGDQTQASYFIRAADLDELGQWLDPIWLRKSPLTNAIKIPNLPPVLPKQLRDPARMPNVEMKRKLIERDGHHCRFCGIPLVRAEVRKRIAELYPNVARWTSPRETDQHRGLQVLWLQYDHLDVHSRGGQTNLDNMVVACVACNFGRDRYTLAEMQMRDPREHNRMPSWKGRFAWTGLEEMLPPHKRLHQAPESPFRNK